MRDIKFSIPNISKQDINLVGKIIKGKINHRGSRLLKMRRVEL